MTIVEILVLLGVVQGLVLGTALLTLRRGNRWANRVIGFVIILFAATLSTELLFATGAYEVLPHLMMATHPLLFLFGPLFLLYALLLMSRTGGVGRWYWLNFVPFFIYVAYLIPFYTLPADAKLTFLHTQADVGATGYILSVAQLAHVITYVGIVYFMVKRHEEVVENTFSATENMSLKWIKTGIRAFLFVGVLMVITTALYAAGLQEVGSVGGAAVLISIVFIIYGIGYRGLWQPEVFVGSRVPEPIRKYDKSTLTPELAETYVKKLQMVMERERPYTNGELTIRDLAQLSRIPSYHLSQVLNENLKERFSDFINRYRVDDAKRQMTDPRNSHVSILQIAYGAGFNSKSTFNAAFKKHVKTTPSEFRRRISSD